MILSKSQFVRGVKCPKSLWLLKNSDVPRDVPDEGQQARFETGHLVGRLARDLFPGGREIPFNPDDFEGMIRQTRAWIDSGVDTLYEATAQANGGFAMADILRREGGGWALYEVKAATGLKDYHLYDAAFQFKVFRDFGVDVRRVFIVHIDRSYVRHGDLALRKLFTVEDVTAQVLAMREEIASRHRGLAAMLEGEMPDRDIGPHCSRFYDCDYASWCWRHIPERSVFGLYRLPGSKKFSLYDRGVLKIGELPGDFNPNFIQSLQIAAEETGRPVVRRGAIRAFLTGLRFPLNFFDFETFMEPVPRFDGQRPYQQMPFQYSLHILHADGRLEHREFLADETRDPRPPLIARMLSDLTPEGSIIAYNKGFEIGRIRELATFEPARARELLGLVDRFADLIVPFRGGGFYHPGFNGSFSLKSVLPALFPDDPELSYQALAIRDGGMAMTAYATLHLEEDPAERAKIRADLLSYCRLDTLAMVKIYKFLNGL